MLTIQRAYSKKSNLKRTCVSARSRMSWKLSRPVLK
jgi:hypothetical protein